MPSLLPPNSTFLEQSVATVNSALADLNTPLRALWNPATCPTALLPYLAWSVSVTRWNRNAPESLKRQAIQHAFILHQHKGTLHALRQVLEPLGYQIQVASWWEIIPPDPAGTFRLQVNLPDGAELTEAQRIEIEILIEDVKPVSRHVIGLMLTRIITGVIEWASAAIDGDILTIYPQMSAAIASTGNLYGACVAYIGETLTVLPFMASALHSSGNVVLGVNLHSIDIWTSAAQNGV